MVWYVTSDQALLQCRGSKTRKEHHNNKRFSTKNVRSLENKNSPPSTHTQILCSICERNDKLVTDPESGEVICSNCGMVLSDKIEEISRPEGNAFSADNKHRIGAPTSLARYDMGLTSVIGKTNRDASGQKMDESMRSTMQRLRTWDSRAYIHSSNDRSLIQAFNELNIMKDKLALSDAIVEKSAYIYRKSQARGLVRGRTTSGIMAAAIYAVCREMETPRTLKDIAAAGNIRRKVLAKAYRKLIVELDFKVPNIDPIKCIVKVANKANLSEKIKRQAMSIMNDVTNNEISAGKDPMAIAATVLYVSCIKNGENIKQNNISNAAGITGVTLRNRFKDLKSQLELN
ncbi:MAG TPA: TFIIB-type zinc ribbon-containing protein [Nitrososphaeraceae archaeon]|nr:TFIIB-type zinc ribbon-containing protein [Nitrososphaeraceae archaeon]